MTGTNFKGFEKIDVEFNDGHTFIVGKNGSGKSSLIDLLHACFKTISQNGSKGELIGERFRFIGPHGANSEVGIFLRDEKDDLNVTITNKISKTGNEIKIEASDGRTLDRKWLNDFFNVAFLSAKNFTSLDPTKQALSLGIDVSKFDEETARLKQEYTSINGALKAFGEIEVVEKVEKVDRVSTTALIEEEREANKFNQEQVDKLDVINDAGRDVGDSEAAIADTKDLLIQKEAELADTRKCLKEQEACLVKEKKALDALPAPEPERDVSVITKKVDGADEINRQAERYEAYVKEMAEYDKEVAAKDAKKEELADNRDSQADGQHQRAKYMKSFNFGFDGLSVCDKGGLLLHNRRLGEFSTAEQVIIVNKLNASRNPDLKTVFIDGFEALDPKNQESIVSELIESEMQVITLEVGSAKKDKSTILLKGCKVVDNYKEEKPSKTKPSLLNGE
jgi:DNA repair exonuclease SbcCD ATPase subunit